MRTCFVRYPEARELASALGIWIKYPQAVQPPSTQELNRLASTITRELVRTKFDRAELRKAAAELRNLAVIGVDTLPPGGRRACHAGCSHCCFGVAYGTPIEFAELAIVIQQTWSVEKIDALKARLNSYCEELLKQRDEDYRRVRIACPLLEKDLCLAYEYRPISCHAQASPGAALCALWKSTDRVGYRVELPNQEDKRAGAIAEGVANALNAAGIEATPVPMAFALRDLLDGVVTPDEFLTTQSRWKSDGPPPWFHAFDPTADSPPELISEADPELDPLLTRVSTEPQSSYLGFLGKERTRDLILRMSPPFCFRTSEEVPVAMENILRATDDVRACYMPYSMRPWAEKLGRLMTQRIATPVAPDLMEPFGPRKPGKIRIGVASHNIRAGSPASWTHGWVQGFDRSEFEVTVMNLQGEEDSDSFRFKDVADRYLHLVGDSLSIARYIREQDFDYLIYPDLGDRGPNYRYAMFRLARRQATGWGGPCTSGLSTIDDYLTSDLMEPEDAQNQYTENLVRLPNSGLTYARLPAGLPLRTRAMFGLPEGHLILLGQYFAKWLPQRDEMLAEISRRSKNPLVLMIHGSPYQTQVLQERFSRLGIRVIALPKLMLPIYLRALELVDVSLDAPDFSGGHTTLNTLQVGTPVVTLPGEYMRSRQGLAFLKLAGVPELIAKNETEYIEIATDAERIRHLRSKIRPDPLFEDLAPLRALEKHILSTV